MECCICIEEWNADERRPKSLPCGHTACLSCLLQLDPLECPECRKKFPGPVNSLLTNFALLKLAGPKSAGRNRRWCVDCGKEAAAKCGDSFHRIGSPGAALSQQLQDLVPLASKELQDLQTQPTLQECSDGALLAALGALTLLGGPPSDWRLTLQREGGGDEDEGEAFTARWRSGDGQDDPREALFKVVAVVLAVTSSNQTLPAGEGDAPDVEAPRPPAGQQPGPASTQPAAPAQAAADPVNDERIPLLDVERVSASYPHQCREEKQDLLQRVRRRGVRGLRNLFCNGDPAWALELLRAASPTLEELVRLVRPRAEHLAEVNAMPRLRTLQIWDDVGLPRDVVLPPRPRPAAQGELEELGVVGPHGLPWPTLQSLLRAHAQTLQKLELGIGTPHRCLVGWPYLCNDLDAKLAACNLVALREITLERGYSTSHDTAQCEGQVAALRRSFPAATVRCDRCS